MSRHAVVQGASRGLGLAFASALVDSPADWRVTATCREGASMGLDELAQRAGDRLRIVPLDVTHPESIERASAAVSEPIDLLLNVAGFLHDEKQGPEKRIEALDAEALARSFAINAIGPALVARAFFPQLRAAERAVLGNLSARVGSIGDNRLGGWYGYRASKAAQNMFTRTLAVEMRRRAPGVICVALHPGTVETDLSSPFQGGVPPERRFSPARAASQLLDLAAKLQPADSGKFFAWDGSEIPW